MKVVDSFPERVHAIEHTWITMPDGVRVSARLWLPESAKHRPVPALFEYIPYRKRDLTRRRDEIHAPYMAGHGFAYARVDIRGSGDSEGVIDDQYSDAELSDGVEIIRWLAAQPWCDGRVGMMGISWGGFNALQIAARRPPALGAVVAVCATDDTYTDNMHYEGGCLLGDNLSEATTMLAFQTCPPDPAIVGDAWRAMWRERLEHHRPWLETWLEHQWRDAYWRPTSVCENYGAIRCPVMAVSGWADGFTDAVFRLMQHLDVPRRGLIGPWSHTYPHLGVPGPAIGFLQEALRWFDCWLRDRDTGVKREPMVRAFMQDSMAPRCTPHAERVGRWVAEEQWPSPRIEPRRLPLDEHHLRLHDGPVPEGTASRSIRSPLTVGLHAGKWCSYVSMPDNPGDQREEDGGALVYESAPLDETLEIFGLPEVELLVSADRPVAQVAVRLGDVLPDGAVTRVTYGLLNLTHRDGHDRPRALTPDEPVHVRVPLNGVAASIPAGHRLRISISSSYWPLAWPPPEPTTLTLYPARSALWLPVRPPRAADEDLRPFGEPEGAASPPLRYVTPPRKNWRVLYDLGQSTATLEVARHDGHFVLPEVDLEIERRTRERYSSCGVDFGSIRGETCTIRRFTRGEWSPRVETRSVLTADSSSFYLHATIDAYEGAERTFNRIFTRRIDRKLV